MLRNNSGRHLAVNSQDHDALIKYAEAQVNRRPITGGNVGLAIAAYQAVLRDNPADTETAKRLVDVYLSPRTISLPGIREAKLVAERHLDARDDPALRFTLARAMYYLQEHAEAVEELRKVLEADPGQIQAYELMGVIAEQHPEIVSDPEKWFNEAVSKNSDSAFAYAVRAAYRLRHDDRSQAMADLERALACDLSDTSAWLRVITEFVRANEWAKAKEQLEALRATSPGEPGLWSLWAGLAIETGEGMDQVAKDGMEALGPNAWDFMPVAIQLLIQSSDRVRNEAGEYELSEQATVDDYLSRMRNKEVDLPMVAYLEGLVAEKRGRLWDAVASWQRAIAMPGIRPETRISAYRKLVPLLSRLGDNRSAISTLQVLMSIEPGNHLFSQLQLTRLYAEEKNWSKVWEESLRLQENATGAPSVMLDAKLLGLRAQANMLAASGAPDTKPQVWQDLESRAAKLDQENDGVLPTKMLRMEIAGMQGKSADVDTMLTELEGKYPDSMRLMSLRAQLCVTQGKEEEAGAKYREMIAKFPEAAEPIQAYAAFLDRRNQRQECESMVKQAFGKMQDPLQRRDLGLLLARLYSRWQENEKSCQWLTDLVAQYPRDILSRSMLLTCESVRQDKAKSQKIIDEIKAIEGEKGTVWRYEQASLLMRSDDESWQEALAEAAQKDPSKLRASPVYPQITKLLQENLQMKPEDQASRMLLAGMYEIAGEQQLALNLLEEAYERSPGNPQVLARLITVLHRAGEFDRAQEYLDEAEQEGLLNPALQRLQVDIDLRHDDVESASETLEQLVDRDPNDSTLKLSYARVLMLRKEFAQAEAILADLRAKHPESIPVAGAQIRLHVQQGETDKALQICNEMVDTLHNANAYLLRAELYLALKENDKAVEDYGQAISLEPENPNTWVARMKVYRGLGRIPEAIADVRQALAHVPDGSPQKLEVQKLAVRLFLASGKQSLHREAEAMIDKAQADLQGKKDSELSALKAQILMALGTGPAIEEARALLRQVTSDDPKYAAAWRLAAQLELGQDELTQALDTATRGLAHNENDKDLLLLKALAEKRRSPSMAATTLSGLAQEYPDDVGIFIEWADAYALADRPEKAVELLEKKLPDFTGTSRRRCEIALAAAMYRNEQEEEAKALFDKLIAANPNDPVPVMTLAGLLRKQSRWTEVNQLVNTWRTTNPKDAETAASIARILAGSGDKEALVMAEDQLRMILGENPQSVPTMVLLSMLMQDAGRNEEAGRLNRQIIDLDPNNVIALNNLAWILCEESTPSPAKLQEALKLANRGLALMPNYMDLLDTRGMVHYRLGNLDKAVADFETCIGLFPTDAPQSAAARFHLARTLADRKSRTEAIDCLKQALILNRKNVQLAEDLANVGRRTHAMKVLRDALALEEEMVKLKERFDSQDFADIEDTDVWTKARLLLDQLQKGL